LEGFLWHHADMEREYLTAAQAAKKLQLDPRTVRRWLNEGKLPGRRLGGKEWRIVDSELREFMLGKKPPAMEERPATRRRKTG
jgi:excisionase family DNA binding protein